MKYVECPEISQPTKNLCQQCLHKDFLLMSIFMGGGITDCPDWQKEMCDLLKDDDVILLNPRRKEFDVTNPDITTEQIRWEFDHLHKADAIMFWFPKETLCPIALYELGFWNSRRGKKLFIGCDPEYKRLKDVVTQTRLSNPMADIVYSLSHLANKVKEWLKT